MHLPTESSVKLDYECIIAVQYGAKTQGDFDSVTYCTLQKTLSIIACCVSRIVPVPVHVCGLDPLE